MIETVQVSTTEGIPFGTPKEIVLWEGLEQAGWKRGRAGSWVHMAPGRTTLALETVNFGPRKGNTVLKIKANLPRLIHGEGAESFTLHPSEVWQGCQAVVVSAQAFCPWVTANLGGYRVHRVDVNATAEMQDHDLDTWLVGTREKFLAIDPDVASWGSHSHRAQVSKQEEIAAYSKTMDTGARGPNGGALGRLESRVFGTKARQVYGETLAEISQEGGVMGRRQIEGWLARMSNAVIAQSVGNVATILIAQGMTPAKAVKMAGVAQVLAASGTKGLEELGVPYLTAYRWQKELEALWTGDGEQGATFDSDAIVWASGEAVRGE